MTDGRRESETLWLAILYIIFSVDIVSRGTQQTTRDQLFSVIFLVYIVSRDTQIFCVIGCSLYYLLSLLFPGAPS